MVAWMRVMVTGEGGCGDTGVGSGDDVIMVWWWWYG